MPGSHNFFFEFAPKVNKIHVLSGTMHLLFGFQDNKTETVNFSICYSKEARAS
jgi:hypothetical protein